MFDVVCHTHRFEAMKANERTTYYQEEYTTKAMRERVFVRLFAYYNNTMNNTGTSSDVLNLYVIMTLFYRHKARVQNTLKKGHRTQAHRRQTPHAS